MLTFHDSYNREPNKAWEFGWRYRLSFYENILNEVFVVAGFFGFFALFSNIQILFWQKDRPH